MWVVVEVVFDQVYVVEVQCSVVVLVIEYVVVDMYFGWQVDCVCLVLVDQILVVQRCLIDIVELWVCWGVDLLDEVLCV